MLKKLDIYMLKKYIAAFFFVMLLLTLVICVVDYAEKSDDFNDAGLSLLDVLKDYYLYYIPFLANIISPLFVFISTIYVANRLASHTEIIAMLSSGMNMWRIMVPFVLGGVLVGSLIFYGVGWVIPKANIKRLEFETKYLDGLDYSVGDDIHVNVNDTTYAYVQTYRHTSGTAYHFTLEQFKDKQLVRKLSTHRIDWDSVTSKWKLHPYWERTYDNGKETLKKYAKKDTLINLFPVDFQNVTGDQIYMTLGELKKEVKRRKDRSLGMWEDYEIEYHVRTAYPMAIIILTVMGFLVAARKTRNGSAGSLVVGFALAFIYYVLLQLGTGVVGGMGLPLWLGAWMPNFIFVFVNVLLYRNIPK